MGLRAAMLLTALSVTLSAQWLNYPTPGIPRTADGKPNLSAPAPRAADGKPDLSGVWGFDGAKYVANITAELKPEDIKPWANTLSQQRAETLFRDDPSDLQCLPQGPRANLYPFPEKIIQTPGIILILMEELAYRQVFMDGRELPRDPNPAFMGYSVGHWDGDTLVIQSTGYNDRTWLDLGGHPHSETMKITERIKRTDFGHLEVEETIDDPKVFNKPFTIRISARYLPDTDLIEYVCAENEKDRAHLVGKISDDRSVPVKVASEVLAKYAGRYDFRFPENPSVPVPVTVTLSDGQLLVDWFGATVPLIPLSSTTFSLAGAPAAFFTDDRGAVRHMTVEFAEGDLKAVRLPDLK